VDSADGVHLGAVILLFRRASFMRSGEGVAKACYYTRTYDEHDALLIANEFLNAELERSRSAVSVQVRRPG
jgi:hypothetical protein